MKKAEIKGRKASLRPCWAALNGGEGGAVENQLIHAAEVGGIQRRTGCGIPGGKGGGNILIAQLPEMTVIEINILHMAIDHAPPRNADICAIFGINEAAFVEPGRIFRIQEIGFNFGEIVDVGGTSAASHPAPDAIPRRFSDQSDRKDTGRLPESPARRRGRSNRQLQPGWPGYSGFFRRRWHRRF